MKDTGVPWLGELPDHWDVQRGKNLFRCIDVRSETGEEELLTVSSERGVVPRRSATVTMFKAESYVGYKLCWPGDLVINSLWAWARGLGVSQYHGIVSTAYGVYRARTGASIDPQFIHNLVRSTAFHWELRVRSKGVWTSRLQLTDESFLGAPFPIPPIPEQTAIVRFLDHVDRRIRRYIRAKQKLIKLLEEQKQVSIHRAVTRGLDPNVRLKPSCVEWLADVPEHWEITRLKFIATQIVDCLHATPVYSANGGYPAIRTADVHPGRLLLANARRVDEDHYQRWTARLVPAQGDILYTREGERFGIAALVPANVPLCISQRMIVFRIHPAHNSAYIMWQINCQHVYAQAAADLIGAAAPHVNVERIKNFWLILPPRPEQDTTVAAVERASAEPNAAIAKAQDEIALLREYRTRLIADVVTGKLDVREAAARLPDEVDEPELDGAEADNDVDAEVADELDAIPEEAEA